jgi:hypothetical protein
LLVPFVTGWIEAPDILSAFGPPWKPSTILDHWTASQIPEQLVEIPEGCEAINAAA